MQALLMTLALAGGVSDSPAQVVVVCPHPLRTALQPWLEYRRAQGWSLTVVSAAGGGPQIKRRIREVAAGSSVSHVVLVGDVPTTAGGENGVPTWIRPRQDGSEPIATDSPYADFDDDQTSDAALGRLPADTPAELDQLLRKTLDYEQSDNHGRWRQRIQILAGAGRLGRWTDALIETVSKRLILEQLPAAWATTLTQAREQSPYCPDPSALRTTVLRQFNEGCLFWIYIGHGHPYALDPLRLPTGNFPLLDVGDTEWLACRQGRPIALFFACYCGAFDAPDDCLAEALLAAPGGPVATIAGTRVTRPYGMALLAEALLQEYLSEQPAQTLGELLWTAKRALTDAAAETPRRRALDAVAQGLSPPGTSLAAERTEHAELFHLLGDPLLRLRQAGNLNLRCASRAVPGESLPVTITAPQEGRLHLELVARRDRLPEGMAGDPGPAHGAERQARYLQANHRCWASQTLPVAAGSHVVELPVPAQASGPCWVRGYLDSPQGESLGAVDVRIAAAPTETVRRARAPAVRRK